MLTKNLLLILILLIAATGLKAYSGGTGTESDPYQIATLNDLKQLSDTEADWDKYFTQTNNISAFETNTWDGGKGFTPVVNFQGVYEGNGHLISDLYIKRPDAIPGVALFGTITGGKVSNLILDNVDITGKASVASLAGSIRNGSIVKNCSASGKIETSGHTNYSNMLFGGLVAYLKDEARIENSSSSCDVYGCKFVGGLVGSIDVSSTVLNSYATGKVNGDAKVGGLAGECFYNSTIKNCYSIGEVSGDETVGGLLGNLDGAAVENSYWDTETSTQASSAGGEGKTTEEMKNPETYVGWDFGGTWLMISSQNYGYPILYWQLTGAISEETIPSSALLMQNYPNPFNPTTTIKFYNGTSAKVELAVYNSQGEMVKKLLDGKIKSGYHSIKFDGSNLNSGIYYYRLMANNRVLSKKMILIK